MTTLGNVMELRILGPLEARVGGEIVPLGGAKQRAVLAALLLREGEVVSVSRLVEEVWGDDPPPSAAHTLESYVSRLRQLFNSHGPRLLRRGAGYCLELAGATLDARTFLALNDEAGLAALEDDHARVVRLTTSALAVWRGPALADVVLASAGRADADRFEELRLGTNELRFDALLALGRHEQVVGEIQPLVRQNPYRERLVAQLMLALYRSGRHAEALDVYERLRVSLDDDLGLQPSADLQKLSAQIVRQDPELRRPPSRPAVQRPTVEPRAGRVSLFAIAATAVVAAMTLTASGGAALPERLPPTADRLALVLPGSSENFGFAAKDVSVAIRSAEIVHDLDTETLFLGDGSSAEVTGAVSRIQANGFGLVVAVGDGPTARALARAVPRMTETRFLFLDASLIDLSLEKAPNAAAVRFADEQTAHLAGYASGRVPTMDGSQGRVDTVSVVAGKPTRRTRRLVSAFEQGIRYAVHGVKVQVDYSNELEDPTACERLANEQIGRGSDVVFAVAGHCGLGALAVARIRGVWSIGATEDGVGVGRHVLMLTYKEWDQAAHYAVDGLLDGTLPMGRDIVLGLEDDYAVNWELGFGVPGYIEAEVVEHCSRLRVTKQRDLS